MAVAVVVEEAVVEKVMVASPLEHHVDLTGVQVLELLAEVALGHKAVAVGVEDVEGGVDLVDLGADGLNPGPCALRRHLLGVEDREA